MNTPLRPRFFGTKIGAATTPFLYTFWIRTRTASPNATSYWRLDFQLKSSKDPASCLEFPLPGQHSHPQALVNPSSPSTEFTRHLPCDPILLSLRSNARVHEPQLRHLPPSSDLLICLHIDLERLPQLPHSSYPGPPSHGTVVVILRENYGFRQGFAP